MKTLKALFLSELAGLYEAENRLAQTMPKLVEAATNNQLREEFESHLTENKAHVTKLEKVFRLFGQSARGKRCQAIASLLREGDEIVSDHKFAPTLDAALIFIAQKVEHYEIASYGGLREWAGQLGNQPAVELLQEILDEEQAADQKLTEIARQHCNQSAQNGDFETRVIYADPNGAYSAANSGATRMLVVPRAGIPTDRNHAARSRNEDQAVKLLPRAGLDLTLRRFPGKSKRLIYA